MTYEEWAVKYQPIPNPSGHGEIFFDHGDQKDLEVLQSWSPYHIWTHVDGDGLNYITNGVRFVNRLGYYITKNAWQEGDEHYID